MARPIRIEYEGACYHVTARGNERKEIFQNDQDRELFLKTLKEMLSTFGAVLHVYCLMPNHYHLVIQTPRGNLSHAMGWFQSTYTNRYNRRHRRSGHLFQGRYKAHLVQADAYARQLVPYIHLNPVRPRDKRAVIPSGRYPAFQIYSWSSHLTYAGKKKAPPWLSLDWLSYWGTNPGQAKRRYLEEIRQYFGQIVTSPWENLRGGLVLGNDQLWEKVQNLVSVKNAQHEIRWNERQEKRQIEDQINRLIQKEKDFRVQLWIRVRLGGQRLADIAREQGYRDGSGVYRVISRLEAVAQQNRSLKNRLDKLRKFCQ